MTCLVVKNFFVHLEMNLLIVILLDKNVDKQVTLQFTCGSAMHTYKIDKKPTNYNQPIKRSGILVKSNLLLVITV